MKGYNTTLSCWVLGRLILLCREWVRFLLLQASEDHVSRRLLHHCYPCSAVLQCHQFAAGLVTTRMVNITLIPDTLGSQDGAHRHYDCNMLQAIAAACTLLQACCSHEQLLLMYLLCLTWTNGDKMISEGKRDLNFQFLT